MQRSTAFNLSRVDQEARYAVLHQIAKLFQKVRPSFTSEDGLCLPSSLLKTQVSGIGVPK